MRGFAMVIFVLGALLIAVMPAQGHVEVANTKALVPHEVIRINSNEEMNSTAASEGWKGDGSHDNPYVIENYVIDARGNTSAIYIGNVSMYVVIRNCTVYNVTTITSYGWGSGITIYRTDYVVVDNVTVHDVARYGVYITSESNYVVVRNSHFYPGSSDYISGIMVSGSYATLKNNTIVGSQGGIWIFAGYYTRLYSNTLINTSIRIDYSYSADQFEIPLNNTVNGKSVRYVRGFEDNKTLDASSFGEVILGKVTWLRVVGLHMENISTGIDILGSSHITIENISLHNIHGDGIVEHLSDNITIENLTLTGSGPQGLRFMVCEDVWIKNSTIKGDEFRNAVYLSSAKRVTLDNISVSGVEDGVYFYGSTNENITLKNSYLFNFTNYGIYANSGSTTSPIRGVFVIGNDFNNTGLDAVYLSTVADSLVARNHIWTTSWNSNLNGVRLLSSSTNVAVEQNLIEGLQSGIVLSSSNSNFIRNNTILDNSYTGVNLYSSSYNAVEYNVINGSHAYGIMTNSGSNSNVFRYNYIGNSSLYGMYFQTDTKYNRIYKNSFYFNHGSNDTFNSSHVQAYDASGGNFWNTSTEGNYWHDWTTPNSNGDEIVDVPYTIDGGAGAQDNYPLAEPTVEIPEYSSLPLLAVLSLLGTLIIRKNS